MKLSSDCDDVVREVVVGEEGGHGKHIRRGQSGNHVALVDEDQGPEGDDVNEC